MRATFATFFLSLASPAIGDPAVVKSGEHPNFSRLVLYTGKFQKWSHSVKENKASIELEGWTDGFDISTVYDFIPKDRISAIKTTASGIDIDLGCFCDVSIDPLSNGGISIDVIHSIRKTRPAFRPPLNKNKPTSKDGPLDKAIEAEGIKEFRKNLLQQVGNATTRSILTSVHLNSPTLNNLENSSQQIYQTRPRKHVRVSKSPSYRDITETQSTNHQNNCPPASYGKIEDWGPEFTFAQQISEIRKSVVGEFDDIDHQTALKLSRSYIRFAMGHEAKAILDQLDKEDREVRFLKSIAVSIEGLQGNADEFLPMNDCIGINTLWAVIIGSEKSRISKEQAKLVSKEFFALPQELKKSLAPKIKDKFTGDGLKMEAEVIKNATSNGKKKETTSDSSLSDLEIAISKGSEASISAITSLLEKSISQNNFVDAHHRDIAQSYIKQQSGTIASDYLLSLAIKDTAISGGYSIALETALSNQDNQYTPDTINFIAQHISAHGSDSQVAKFFIASNKNSLKFKKETEEKISNRIITSGLKKLLSDHDSSHAHANIMPPSTPHETSRALDQINPETPELVLSRSQSSRADIQKLLKSSDLR